MAFSPPRCNCPDATNQRQGDPAGASISLQVSSDWSTGFDGIRDKGGYCIHELAVLRIRKEISAAFPDGIPSDIRTPDAFKVKAKRLRYKLQVPNRLGDDFS